MMDCCASDGPASEYLERRWFATLDAVTAQEAECEILLEVLKVSESAWRDACERLDSLQGLRNALEEQIDALHGFKESKSPAWDEPQDIDDRFQPVPHRIRR